MAYFDVVTITALNAVNGLYLTPDMYFCVVNIAASSEPSPVIDFVHRFHATQPHTESYDEFSDIAGDAFLDWRDENRQGPVPVYRSHFGEVAMMAEDLASTYTQIRRGLYAAVDVALAVHLRSIQAPDDTEYRRVIPAGLAEMRIEQLDDITSDTFFRILSVEPWVSWIERLRAQKQRSANYLSRSDTELMLGEGTRVLLDILKEYHTRKASKLRQIEYRRLAAARKSIRKSIKLFERLNGMADLRRFLASRNEPPTGPRLGLVIEGHTYDYHLFMRPNSLLRTTLDCNSRISPAGTVVYNKQGKRLCDLCLFFEDMPLLDNVMATALSAKNETTELEMLHAACVIDTPRWFYDDPILPDLKNLHDPATVPTMIENVFNYTDSLADDHRHMRDTLITDTLPFAYGAFVRMLRPGKRYLPIMRECSTHSIWDYMAEDAPAMASLALAQQALQEGAY
jgi:hypothetical protein